MLVMIWLSSVILSINRIENADNLVSAYTGYPGKWLLYDRSSWSLRISRPKLNREANSKVYNGGSIPGRFSADDCNSCDASSGCNGGNRLAVAAEVESGWWRCRCVCECVCVWDRSAALAAAAAATPASPENPGTPSPADASCSRNRGSAGILSLSAAGARLAGLWSMAAAAW